MSLATGDEWRLRRLSSFESRATSDFGESIVRDELPNGPGESRKLFRFKRFGETTTFIQESAQIDLFNDGNLWQAIKEGRIQDVLRYANEDFVELLPDGNKVVVGKRGACERGGEGETILHVAVLLKHKELVKKIVDAFPDLVNQVYLRKKYFGETALHIAVVTSAIGDLEIVQYLVENGAKINGPMAIGSEFLKDSDKGCLYYGQTILQFAAATHKNKILRYLVENKYDPADLTAVDIYGNNVLHILAYYGDFDLHVFNFIKNRNLVDLSQQRTSINLMKSRNKDSLTPFQVGISRGHVNIIDTIKQLEWEFGNVRHYKVNIDDLDPIQPSNESGQRVSKSALEIAVDNEDRAIINHPLFESLLKIKWVLYARRKFLQKLFMWAFFVISFTCAIAFQPHTLELRRSYIVNTGNNFPMVRVVFEGIAIIGVLMTIIGELIEWYIQGSLYFSGYGAAENVVQWLNSYLIAMVPVIRYGVAALVSQDQWGRLIDAENCLFGIAAILGWIYLLSYSKGFKNVGPLIIVFRKILTEDLIQWMYLYMAITSGFAAALYLQMNDVPDHTQYNLFPALDWNNYLGSVQWVIRFLFAQAAFDDFRESKLPVFTEFLFIMYGFLVLVLLINVLIAKLVETFKEVAKHSKEFWAVQFAFVIIGVDEKLAEQERHFLLRHIGWHDSTIESEKLVVPRYFLYTERDIPDRENPGKKFVQTIKLVVARDHNGKGIEVRTDCGHWDGWVRDLIVPFGVMRSEHKKAATRQTNMWLGSRFALHYGDSSVYQKINDRYLKGKKEE